MDFCGGLNAGGLFSRRHLGSCEIPFTSDAHCIILIHF